MPGLTGPLHRSIRPACSGSWQCNLDALRLPEFRDALIVGVIAVVFAAVLVAIRRRSPEFAEPVEWGWIAVLAVVAAMSVSHHLLPTAAVGLALLLAAGIVVQWQSLRTPWHLVLLLPGAVVVAYSPALRSILPPWADLAVTLGIVAGGWAGAVLDRQAKLRGFAPALYAITAVGLYTVVPDTDFALVLSGALLPLAVLSPLGDGLRTGPAGAAGLAGCVCLVAAVGGYGRPSAIVGGIACLGVLALSPSLLRRMTLPAVVAVHVILVWYAARVAGRAALARRAVLLLLIGELVVAGILSLATRPRVTTSR